MTAYLSARYIRHYNNPVSLRLLQAKQLDPDFGLDDEDEDGWDDALGYLDACGPGIQHQIARTTSLENNLGASSLKSNGSETVQFSVDDSQKDKVEVHIHLNPTILCLVSPLSQSSSGQLLGQPILVSTESLVVVSDPSKHGGTLHI